MGVTIKTNAGEIAAALDLKAAQVRSGLRALVRHHGVLLQARAKANAAGRPGPRIQTGDLNRSIALQVDGNASISRARVGTNKPQARRLEYGFRGVDSLGRRWDQPPYPFLGPALDQVADGFVKAIEQLAGGD
jgi:hypothetical protein